MVCGLWNCENQKCEKKNLGWLSEQMKKQRKKQGKEWKKAPSTNITQQKEETEGKSAESLCATGQIVL